MRICHILVAVALASTLAVMVTPSEERPSAKVIVGTWVIDSAKGDSVGPLVVPTEFTRGGEVRMVMGFSKGAASERIGSYKLRGRTLEVIWGAGSKEVARYEVTHLTEAEMAWSYDDGKKEVVFVRFTPTG